MMNVFFYRKKSVLERERLRFLSIGREREQIKF